MQPDSASSLKPVTSFLASLPLIQILLCIAIPLATAWVSVQVTQGTIQTRLSTVEDGLKTRKEEQGHFITKEEFNARWQHVQADLQEIKEGVKEIRRSQKDSGGGSTHSHKH